MTVNDDEETNQPPPKKRFEQQQEEDEPSSFLQCAELVLPWLTPPELAAASLACKSLRRISAAVTSRRVADAAGGLEPHPIPFQSPSGEKPLYSHFLYSPSQTPSSPSSSKRQSWGSPGAFRSELARFETALLGPGGAVPGCGCSGSCGGGDGCPCFGFGDDVAGECGSGCGCGPECVNRASQRGVSVRLKIVRDVNKGWCLCADEFISRGHFVCEYAGELLTTTEARRRQQKYDEVASQARFSSALLVVREHLPSGKACLRLNIDATRIGNVARFINHSCDGGNLSSILVRSSGSLLPRLCFFASRDIKKDEELTFSYGGTRLSSNGSRCYCGSSSCLGWLPSEQT